MYGKTITKVLKNFVEKFEKNFEKFENSQKKL